MKKTFKLENLGCANCAAKMESKIRKLDGVESANISFMSSRLTIEGEEADFESLIKEAAYICRKIEPDCKLVMPVGAAQ